jgi:HSP20 family protein
MNQPLGIWKRTSPLSPFRDLTRLMDTWTGWPEFSGSTSAPSYLPAVDVQENEQAYLMKFDLPGMKQEDIKVEAHENQITVSGERRSESESTRGHQHLAEVNYGSFLRRFTLPQHIEMEKVSAKYENGVLTVEVAKAEKSKPKTISVQVK